MFEVHVLVQPYQEGRLLSLLHEIKNHVPELNSVKVMATLTSTGCMPRQPMVSGFTRSGACRDTALRLASRLMLFLTGQGLTVTRTKVEQLITPNDLTDDQSVSGDEYYEAHIKVGSSMPNTREYRWLALLCLRHGVQLLLNPYSIKMAPVTTMRSYDCTGTEFMQQHQALVNDLTQAGFSQYKVHMERGIYDSNPYTDSGWLFSGKDYKDYKTPIRTLDEDHDERRLHVPVESETAVMTYIDEIRRLLVVKGGDANMDAEIDRYFIVSVPKKYKFDVAEHFMDGKWLSMVIGLDPTYEYLNTPEKRENENFHTVNKAIKAYESGT
jgi:hypothetical protein